MYINILLDTVLATDVNKYSLAFASCQPIWRTLVGERDLFLPVAKDCGIVVYLNQSQQVRVLVSQPITAYVGHIPWQLPVNSLSVTSADLVV